MDTNTKNDSKLENFITAVYDEADKKSISIVENAEKSSNEILKDIEKQANDDALKFVFETTKRIEIKTVKTIAKAELDGKKSILAKREKLTQKVFNNVELKLSEFRNTNRYVEFLVKLLKDEKLKDNVKICLMPSDMKYVDDINRSLNTSYDFVEDRSIRMGGIMLYYENEGYVIDKTFDNAFKAQEELFHECNYFGKVLAE